MSGFQTSMSVRIIQGIWKHANRFLGVIFTVSEFLSLGRALGPCNFLRLPGDSAAVGSYSEKNYWGIISIWQWRKMFAAVQQLVWWPSYHHISEIRKVSKHLLFHMPLLCSRTCNGFFFPFPDWVQTSLWMSRLQVMGYFTPAALYCIYVVSYLFIKNHQNFIESFPYIRPCPIH